VSVDIVLYKTRLFKVSKEYFSIILFKNSIFAKGREINNKLVDNKRMASEIPTHMLNPKKFVISDLKFSLRALVICGLFNITKLVTKKEYIILLTFLVFCNSELLYQFLNSLHIVRCVNWIIPIKGPLRPNILLFELAATTVLTIPNPGIINI
jgi:hypothetical protein